ncbi:hypothetical protein Poly30_49010 [Planctomycetes bacterium Poly30]|uniref:DUF7309 domain-containing protein n=1 Tax=Saltatorellus ferox TaxID=2528018 RepID=A0A518EZ27_9BACT|nr:hypothetical protein Poly30_49010 [Planctomycetes bacterium Poly30]
MPTQPQRLLQLATELQRLEPWSQVGESSVFLVKVPGHARPFAVTVFGDTVDVKGIEVSLEPQGFRRLAKLHDPEASDDEIESFRPGSALSLVFLPPGQIQPEFRKVWKAAAFRPSGGRPAPQFAATDAGGEIRPIKRSEGTILGYCAHAVVEALSSGRLFPPNLADGDEAALLLIVPGDDPEAFEDPELPEVEVDVVDWPDANGDLPAPYAVARDVIAAAEALPREKSLLAISSFRSEGRDEPKVAADAHVLLLHDPKGQRLVASEIEDDDDEGQPLEAVLLRLFEAHGHIPEGLMMESARLALVAFPLCRALGIHPHLGDFAGSLAHQVDDETRDHGGTPRARLANTLRALDAIGGENMPMNFPSQLMSEDDWEAAFRYTGANLVIDAEQTGALTEATERYWGGARGQARVLELMASMGAMQAFLGYALEDHVFTGNGRTVLDDYLEEARRSGKLGEAEISALECRRNAVVSLFELSGDGHTATDLLDGRNFPVEIDLDDAGRFSGHSLLMRHYELGDYHAFSMAGFPSIAERREDQRSRIAKALGASPSHELLRSKGAALGAIWLQSVPQLEAALQRIK